MAESWSTPCAEVDLRVGGTYRVDMSTGSGTILTYRGIYHEVLPPDRLVFTWPLMAQTHIVSTVTVELSDRAGGGTVLVLTHEALGDEDTARAIEEGWSAVLDMLARRGLHADG